MFNLTSVQFEDVYNQEFIGLYSIAIDISLVLNIIFIIPIFYIVLTQSPKEMSTCKYYFCLNFSADLLFNILMGFIKPYPLLPMWVIVPLGITKTLGDDFAYWTFEIIAICFVLISLSQGFQQLYRFTAVLPWEFVGKLFESYPHAPITFVCSYLFLLIPVGFLHVSRVDTNYFKYDFLCT